MSTTPDLLEDRRARNNERMMALGRFCAIVLAVPAITLGVLLGLVLRSPVLGGLAMLVVAAGLAGGMFVSMRGFGDRFIASLTPTPADETEHARLHNLAEGLCIANGLNKPVLWVVDTPACNVATIMMAGGESPQSAMVVTAGLLQALSRIELEAVLAQQLGHVRDGDVSLSTFAASLVAIPVVGPILTPRVRGALDPDLETYGDLVGVRITRYPPGLASALETIGRHPTAVPGARPAAAHLWMVDPLGPVGDPRSADAGAPDSAPSGPVLITHPPLDDRIAVLREL